MSTSCDIPFCRAEYWVSGSQMLGLTQSQQTAVGKHKIFQGKKKSICNFPAFFPFRMGWKGSSLWSLFILEIFFLLQISILIVIIQRWGQRFSVPKGYQVWVNWTFHLIKQFLSNSSEYLVFHGFDSLPFVTESYSDFLSSLNISILVVKWKWLDLFVEEVGQGKNC